MTDLAKIKQILQAQKPYLYHEYGVTEIGVFGSWVRGEQNADSDLDILISLTDPPRISLLGLVSLENYLSDLLELKVDVALKGNLKKRIGQRILQEAEAI
jgi:predicted nucleotidyltransferase